MAMVRPLVEGDIPQVADLHRRVFQVALESSPEQRAAYRQYFSDVFLNELWKQDGIGSWVNEEDSGVLTGFLGVVPRRMSMNGSRVLAAVSSQFITDADSRSRMVGVKLLKAFLQGPQDLSVADESNDASRKLWEALGGKTALLHSMHWIRLLRPCSLATSYLAQRRALGGLARAAAPIARAADVLVTRLAGSPLRHDAPALRAEGMSPEALLEHLPAFVGRGTLRPEYDVHTLRWAIARVSCQRERDEPESVLLRDERGRPVGSYVHCPSPGGVDQVLYIAAIPQAVEDVVRHLLHRAFQRGALAVAGRLDVRIMQALSNRHALFHRRGPWMLVHTRRPELLGAFERGEAFFSRLEGEFCLRFRPVGQCALPWG